MISKVLNLIKTTLINNFQLTNIDYSTWVFSSSFNTKYNYNSKYLFEYVLNNNSDITPKYVINDDELRSKLQEKYGEQYFIETKSINGIKQVLKAGVWFTSAGLPVYGLELSRKRLIVNLWHGVPLKKIALMDNNLNKLTKIYFNYIFSKNYTHILTTSDNLVPIMKESFNVEEDKIKVWGQPRNDTIFNINNRDKILKLLYENLPPYRKIILYAPTYRDDSKTVFFPFKDFNFEDLIKYLEQNKFIIFIRCHQSETQDIKEFSHDRIKVINSDKVEDIMEIINIFDLLITDYSSIYIDFLLTEKPIIFLPYDKEEYLKKRGLNFNYNYVTPGPKLSTFREFKSELFKLLNESEYYLLERQEANLFFNDIREPCSYRIYDEIKKEIEKFNI